MPLSPDAIERIIARALALDLAFLRGGARKRHVPFSLTPSPIGIAEYQSLVRASLIFGRMTQAMADDSNLIQSLHAQLAEGDRFFAELLSIHRQLHGASEPPARVPLLLQRSDFMLDEVLGPRLIECNSIAAGMAPFGEQLTQLHGELKEALPDDYQRYAEHGSGAPIANHATANFAESVAQAAQLMRREHGDPGAPSFVMVVQENEDNVYDQHLLERRLQTLGIQTFRRTFRELHEQLTSGPNKRLLLRGEGALDLVYLRAGYQYRDYHAPDLDKQRCCDALRATRLFIERHRVVVNATVAQQLATSKRAQQYLFETPVEHLSALGVPRSELAWVKQFLVDMYSVDERMISALKSTDESDNWVLKNQGEGGGHCVFGADIVTKISALHKAQYRAWVLMRKLRPVPRENGTVVIRDGLASIVEGLVSEVGVFTAHIDFAGSLSSELNGARYLGYLVRSKPGDVTEGGVHSGFGVLDSLVYRDD